MRTSSSSELASCSLDRPSPASREHDRRPAAGHHIARALSCTSLSRPDRGLTPVCRSLAASTRPSSTPLRPRSSSRASRARRSVPLRARLVSEGRARTLPISSWLDDPLCLLARADLTAVTCVPPTQMEDQFEKVCLSHVLLLPLWPSVQAEPRCSSCRQSTGIDIEKYLPGQQQQQQQQQQQGGAPPASDVRTSSSSSGQSLIPSCPPPTTSSPCPAPFSTLLGLPLIRATRAELLLPPLSPI